MNLDEHHIFGAHGNYRIDSVNLPQIKTAATLENITKRYREYKNDKQKFLMMFSKRLRRSIPLDTHLNKMTIKIKKGEYINICGSYAKPRNAFCDLLKGIVYPDFGRLWINGNVINIKAMKSSFVAYLSAEENIRRMSKLGQMEQEEVTSLFERVLEFSEIPEKYAKMPLKKLSQIKVNQLKSAYYLHAPYDILILDELIPQVSDEYNRKCNARIREMLEDESVCIIRPTSAPVIGNELVTRTLLFGEMKPIYDGKDTERAMELYKKTKAKVLEVESEVEVEVEEDDDSSDF